jgi:hypothetical protein
MVWTVPIMPGMPGNPQECRANAKRCLELAKAAGMPTSRETFESLAQTWLALATDYEATTLHEFERFAATRIDHTIASL